MIVPIKAGPLYRDRLREAIKKAAEQFGIKAPIEEHVLSTLVSIGFQHGWDAHNEGLIQAIETLATGLEEDKKGK